MKDLRMPLEDQNELDDYLLDNEPAEEIGPEFLRQQQMAYSDSGTPMGPEGGFRASQSRPETTPISNKEVVKDTLNVSKSPSMSTSQDKPSTQEETNVQRYQRMLDELDAIRMEPKKDLTMLRGANQIAQAIASGYGGKLGDNNDVVDKLENKSQQRFNDLLNQLKVAKEINAMKGSTKPSQQSGIFGKTPDGKLIPLIFDPNASKYVNPFTGEVAGPDTEIIRNTLYTDAFGNKVALGSSGVETMKSSARGETPQAVNEKFSETSTFNPDQVQVKALDAETKRLDAATKEINQKVDATFRLRSVLNSNNKLTGAMVKSQFPRLAGEVGNLNQAEQEVWMGSSAWLDKIDQFLDTIANSQITPENKKQLNELIDIFQKTSSSAKNSILDASANRLNMVHRIPSDFTKQSYGDLRQYTPQGSASNQETVKIKGPSGKIVDVLKDKAEKYLSREGYELVK